jgi:hypothetical protein
MVQTTLSGPLSPSCEEWSQASALRTSCPHDRPYRVDVVGASGFGFALTWYAVACSRSTCDMGTGVRLPGERPGPVSGRGCSERPVDWQVEHAARDGPCT